MTALSASFEIALEGGGGNGKCFCDLGLADSVLSRWRKEYHERGEAAFLPQPCEQASTQDQRIVELERFCGQLALENQVLKKALQSMGSRSATS